MSNFREYINEEKNEKMVSCPGCGKKVASRDMRITKPHKGKLICKWCEAKEPK